MWHFKGDCGCEVQSVLQYYQTKVCVNVHFKSTVSAKFTCDDLCGESESY